MKNLSVQEKKDLDNCVFKTLGKKEPPALVLLFKKNTFKIKDFLLF
ncbi:hypothetical protein ACRDP0_001307 [Campylobacter coli]